MRRIALLIALSILAVPASAQRNRQPQVSAEALSAMQTREIDQEKNIVFAAVLSTLASNNYRIDMADKDSGIITATENTQSKMSGMGLVTKQNTIKLTVVLSETDAKRTKVRITAIDNYVYTYHGKKHRDENSSVTTEAVYKKLFDSIVTSL